MDLETEWQNSPAADYLGKAGHSSQTAHLDDDDDEFVW